jgi:hypothetical protein
LLKRIVCESKLLLRMTRGVRAAPSLMVAWRWMERRSEWAIQISLASFGAAADVWSPVLWLLLLLLLLL